MALAKSQKSLKSWTKQKWRTKSGKPSTQGAKATGERYLPEKAIKALSDKEYAATTKAKRKAKKSGKQVAKQPKKIAKKVRKYKQDIFQSRNTMGRIFMAIMIPAVGLIAKKVKECYIRQDLIEIRIALELHRLQHGKYPEKLQDMAQSETLPKDPWSNYKEDYRYNLAKKKLYSISIDLKDDSGVINPLKTYGAAQANFNSGAPDYGLNLVTVKP